MKKTATFALCTVACSAFATVMTSPIELSGVSYYQDRDTQKVHVSYALSNQGEPAYVVMDVLTNGVSIGLENIRTFGAGSAVSQFDGDPVAEGSGKTIVWDARKDWKGNLSTNAVVQLSACYTNLFEVYMVVDLSEGPSATRYPVSYTIMPPDLQTDISCMSNKLWLRRVNAGTFTMGSPVGETGRNEREIQREVTLTKPFYFGVFPVTVEQYRLVTGDVKSIGSASIAEADFRLAPAYGVTWVNVRGPFDDSSKTWPNSTYVAPDSFMGLLRDKTGLDGFDLPTEAQWEYACRAGTTTAWNNGTDCTVAAGVKTVEDENLNLLGWYCMNSGSKMHRVGLKLPNNWGIYDCHGNVWEWCLDVAIDPVAGSVTDPKGDTNTSKNRSKRGGGYDSAGASCRSAMRNNDNPTNSSTSGFRCAFQIGY